ncbi:hypothetical protein CR513_51844, partial [Mucuna pruriens]
MYPKSIMAKSTTPTSLTSFMSIKALSENLTLHILHNKMRKNCTIREMARSMLKEKGIPNIFWVEAVYTTVYIFNRYLTSAVQDNTFIEAWSGQKS